MPMAEAGSWGSLVPDRIRWHHIHSLPFVVFFHPKFGVR